MPFVFSRWQLAAVGGFDALAHEVNRQGVADHVGPGAGVAAGM
jgi:hypothetical protein